MSERTLEAHELVDAVRRPSFELQEAAIRAGYGSVRDWVLDQCVAEIRVLKGRVDVLEARVYSLERALYDDGGIVDAQG